MNKFFKKPHSGFSLIEVAIAVVIIGIITGMALKGRDLIHTVKLRAVINQVNTTKIAVQMFIDKYGAFPGSLNNASEIIADNITNGNGGDAISTKEEASIFWNQLIGAEMISFEMNGKFPTSKLGGIFTASSNVDGFPGTWLILCGSTTDNKNFTGIMSPEDARFIDKNSDTGEPTTGDVRVLKASNASGECIVGDKYNLKNKSNDCVLLFKLQ